VRNALAAISAMLASVIATPPTIAASPLPLAMRITTAASMPTSRPRINPTIPADVENPLTTSSRAVSRPVNP
jgi:hypothetical protein